MNMLQSISLQVYYNLVISVKGNPIDAKETKIKRRLRKGFPRKLKEQYNAMLDLF